MHEANRRPGTDGVVTLRFLLREATADAHAALHALPAFSRLARSAIGQAEYGNLLQRMESFYAALDPALAAAGRCLGRVTAGAEHRERAPLLARDLAAARLVPERPGPAVPAAFGCPAAYAGALYVVDGALLGGAVLCRAAGRLDWPAPAGFWRWAEGEGPALWRRTLALIERVDAGEASRGAAVAAALATFHGFRRWMERRPEPLPEPIREPLAEPLTGAA